MSFLSVNGTLVVQLINFAIFFAILNVVFLRPVAAAIKRRRDYINSLVSDYDRYQAQVRELRVQAESIRIGARRRAEQGFSAARARASNEAAQLSTQYARQAQSIVDGAQETARAELESARARGGDAVRALADLMLERVLPEAAPR